MTRNTLPTTYSVCVRYTDCSDYSIGREDFKFHSLKNAVAYALKLGECSDVLDAEVISEETGEVMLTISDGIIDYVTLEAAEFYD